MPVKINYFDFNHLISFSFSLSKIKYNIFMTLVKKLKLGKKKTVPNTPHMERTVGCEFRFILYWSFIIFLLNNKQVNGS